MDNPTHELLFCSYDILYDLAKDIDKELEGKT